MLQAKRLSWRDVNTFQVSLSGELGGRFKIDQTDDLVLWTPLATLTNFYGTAQFTDPSPTNRTHRFYRAERY